MGGVGKVSVDASVGYEWRLHDSDNNEHHMLLPFMHLPIQSKHGEQLCRPDIPPSRGGRAESC